MDSLKLLIGLRDYASLNALPLSCYTALRDRLLL